MSRIYISNLVSLIFFSFHFHFECEVTKNVTEVAKNICGTKNVTGVTKNVTEVAKNVCEQKT